MGTFLILSISVKEKIYKTLIRPQLEYAYASCAWSPWLKQDISELKKVQRCAARFVYNNYWPMASVTEIISTLFCTIFRIVSYFIFCMLQIQQLVPINS